MNLIYGSDLLGDPQTRQLDEFTIRERVQPNIDVIRSATSTAARLLGREGEIGTLTHGAHADLLVLEVGPEQDLAVRDAPILVWAFIFSQRRRSTCATYSTPGWSPTSRQHAICRVRRAFLARQCPTNLRLRVLTHVERTSPVYGNSDDLGGRTMYRK